MPNDNADWMRNEDSIIHKDSLLSPKDRARLDKVRAQLAAGVNPYSDVKDRSLTIGNRSMIPVVKKITRRVRQALVKRWKSGDPNEIVRKKGGGIVVVLGKQVKPEYTEILTCSFCGAQVHESTITKAKEFSGFISNKRDPFGFVPMNKSVRACPNCVGRIRR